MNIYLSQELQAHRRGRFLASLLSITASLETQWPSSGVVLMTGEQLQASPELGSQCVAWARQPGCTLLLLPPYNEGRILPALDWMIAFTSTPIEAFPPDSLERILAAEVLHQLQGVDGSATTSTVSEQACHTRFWKAHSNSGVIAATTLPLWSISLLGYTDKVMDFLRGIVKNTGKASPPMLAEQPKSDGMLPQDVTVLVCCYGFGVATPSDLVKKLRECTVPLLKLDSFDLPKSFQCLRRCGLLDDQGLTNSGLAFLKASKYWLFAENLKREA